MLVFCLHGETEYEKPDSVWRGFIRKSRLIDVPQNFVEVVAAIAAFLGPITKNMAGGRVFKATWKAPGPWQFK